MKDSPEFVAHSASNGESFMIDGRKIKSIMKDSPEFVAHSASNGYAEILSHSFTAQALALFVSCLDKKNITVSTQFNPLS